MSMVFICSRTDGIEFDNDLAWRKSF